MGQRRKDHFAESNRFHSSSEERRPFMRVHHLLTALCLLGTIICRASAAGPADSVVKIFATVRYPNPVRPWANGDRVEVIGTGAVIEGKKILTNAHVVLYATEILIQGRPGEEKIEAAVDGIAPAMDLATLAIKEDKFFQKHPPVTRARKLPKVQDNVAVYGFPVGGSDLSVTKGVVSRIEFGRYYRQGMGLIIQVSAAINSGNSGGPALAGSEMIGIVMSRLTEGENIGYVIPNEEIDTFLEDIKDGHYDGKPVEESGTTFQRLENEALRRFLQVDKKTTGVLAVPPRRRDASCPFQEFDVLTKIGDYTIDNEGMVQLPNDLRLSFYSLIPRLARNNAVPATIVRKGRTLAIALRVSNEEKQLITDYKGEKPSYFIHGPLVFSVIRSESVEHYTELKPLLYFNGSPIISRCYDRVRFPGEELVVVASPMLNHKIAKGYRDPVGQIVKELNGVTIKNLRHLVESIRDSKDEYLRFRFAEEGSEQLVFNRAEMNQTTEEIMDDNGISLTRRGSADMLKLWKKSPATTAR
jgi:S1-C subfamily serine protease